MYQIPAGKLDNAKLFLWPTCVVARGNIIEDLQGRFRQGESIRTSWIESVEYDADSNISTVYTRNSIYTSDDNILEGITEDTVISGNDLFKLMSDQAPLDLPSPQPLTKKEEELLNCMIF